MGGCDSRECRCLLAVRMIVIFLRAVALAGSTSLACGRKRRRSASPSSSKPLVGAHATDARTRSNASPSHVGEARILQVILLACCLTRTGTSRLGPPCKTKLHETSDHAASTSHSCARDSWAHHSFQTSSTAYKLQPLLLTSHNISQLGASYTKTPVRSSCIRRIGV